MYLYCVCKFFCHFIDHAVLVCVQARLENTFPMYMYARQCKARQGNCGFVITLRPKTLKHIRGGWSHYTDTSFTLLWPEWGSNPIPSHPQSELLIDAPQARAQGNANFNVKVNNLFNVNRTIIISLYFFVLIALLGYTFCKVQCFLVMQGR
jgi:hypothetical protein